MYFPIMFWFLAGWGPIPKAQGMVGDGRLWHFDLVNQILESDSGNDAIHPRQKVFFDNLFLLLCFRPFLILFSLYVFFSEFI